MISAHFPVLVVVLPLIAAFTAFLAGWADRRYCYPIAAAAIAVQLAISLDILREVLAGGTVRYFLGNWPPPWGIEYVIDRLNAYVLVILLLLSLLCCIYSKRSIGREIDPEKTVGFYVVFLLLVAGVCGIAVTGDIFNLYVFLEISSIAAYTLVASGRRRKGLLAGFNYLIMGSVSAGFILLGIGHLYVATGTLNMADLARLLPALYDSTIIHTAFVFFIVGLSIKTAIFPLHIWLPDAYTQAPSAVSALISTVVSKMGVYATIRILFSVFTVGFIVDYLPIMEIFAWVAAFAIIAGSVLAIAQYDMKRMLAYSSVSQMGYIMLGIGIANSIAMTGGILHILNHALMKGCLFMVAGAIIYQTGLQNIDDFKGLAERTPCTCAIFFIAALSMIGIPPTVGFMSKWYLALGAVEAGQWIFVAVILASSLLNAVYFWRVFEYAYFRHADADLPAREKRELPATMLAPMIVLAAGCVLFFFFVSIPLAIIEPVVAALLGGA
ncbi:MAG: monovalent cation/H+ antiporter subunit D family protein [Methanomicrobiaceae archaeon]|uniref:Ph adaptation potassium efflux system protein d 1 n=1 Tax=hydrocarbon metagenome TaxID=938273 RepID=A0A0W8FDQ2_9ZZZZ|nr:monovalent cation/H+ antiporter subunit D family protein [Methanomicrobiaceae archaeon]MDD5419177.1 monovalent cation/H+ antiporter subunit D family protein [Methanomicrobiaceae archaeon]